jgi:hypothetical protein
MANDPELLGLPVRQMDLSGGTNKILKSIACKTIGELMAMTPERLVEAGLGAAALKEIAAAALDLGLTWQSTDVIRAASPPAGPVTLDLPKAVAKLERNTYVLEQWTPPNVRMTDVRCATCDHPLRLLAHLDLTAFPDSGLPTGSLRAGRCDHGDCTRFLPKPGQWAVLLESNGGDRPAFRRELDYPSDDELPKLPSERVSTMLNDHKFDTIGVLPRVGGWPNAMHKVDWPNCTSCAKRTLLAFQQPGDGQVELVFVCPGGCSDGGGYVLVVD